MNVNKLKFVYLIFEYDVKQQRRGAVMGYLKIPVKSLTACFTVV